MSLSAFMVQYFAGVSLMLFFAPIANDQREKPKRRIAATIIIVAAVIGAVRSAFIYAPHILKYLFS